MIWTTTKPTQPGWYWYQPPKPANILMVYIRRSPVQAGTVAHEFEFSDVRIQSYIERAENYHGEWSGPLEPPIDYQAQAVSDELPYAN